MPLHPLVLMLVLTLMPRAAEDLVGFRMPSNNVGCQMFTDEGETVLRCDIAEMKVLPPPPADCEGEFGHSFQMTERGTADRICAGDSLIDPRLPILGYGGTWQRGSFTCRSEQAGLTCFNAAQRGFFLSRVEQRVF